MSHPDRNVVWGFGKTALALLVSLVWAGCGGGGSGASGSPGNASNAPTNPSTSTPTNTPTTNTSTSNVDDDPTLATYVCTSNLATTPGKLKLLPLGTTGKAQTRGYAEYVPPTYASASKWPCIINLHGDGELGDGSSEAVLQSFTYSCLPGMIQQDNWDSQHRFVVLSPQFASYADRTAANVNTFIQYAKANYKIDVKRIYLTAVSGGGVALGNYLTTFSGGEAAAAIPVSCYVPPIGSAAKWKSVPVWMLCGSADTTVNPANVLKVYTALMAAVPPPVVTPRITLYTGVGHDINSCNKSYSPASMDNHFETTYGGVDLVPYSNIYDWMLQYHR